ncbi:WD40-repeat-containing domain protein [Apodospora peruviana]|uniref:ASTRA-associated protein 1 n=1 Tax=Apodospora peruviana TaxID=516989 RepID=A0AAE0M3Z3_9PEZI|nr:WD40-repeat-containing domain protein [Apodospora peruviana]
MATEAKPAQPKSVLRGHKAQVHATAFVSRNERLMTGDADGFVIAWDLTVMRPRAVWQAHTNAILGITGWGADRVITHGRDNKLIVWKLDGEDETQMSTVLPLDPSTEPRPQPWILHMLEVNTMNFCSFAHCAISRDEILIAVPNTLASEAIDIFHLPSQARQHTVKLGDKNGMVMVLSILTQGLCLTLVAGYENGLTIVAHFDPETTEWKVKYQAKSHSQPILSLDISPSKDFFITSSADAILAKHPLPAPPLPRKQQSDSSAPEHESNPQTADTRTNPPSLLSTSLNKTPISTTSTKTSTNVALTEPLKTVNTKHSGQQGLRIRSDGRIFATAGWDSKVRVYSAKTLKEVAVLKWHQVGCYAIAFAEVEVDVGKNGQKGDTATTATVPEGHQSQSQEDDDGKSMTSIPKVVELTVREKRIREARSAHWLAAGSKDCKVSLWDVF